MVVYWDAVFFLSFLIDFLLIVGSNRLFGHPQRWLRTVFAALIGGIYTTACMIPSFFSLRHIVFRILCMIVMSVTAFGISFAALRKAAILFLLSMALGGMSIWFNGDDKLSVGAAMICLLVLSFIGLRGRPWSRTMVPVEINSGEKCIKIIALCDTGNLLRDPITGRTVLVIGRDIAERLVGLSREQLSHPVETMERKLLPGLRLISYKTVGNGEGFLLAQYFPSVKVGNVNGGSLVAFSPEILSSDGAYQALTGGIC